MTAVSAEFLARWRGDTEALAFGDAHRLRIPVAKVYIRTGRLRRNWRPWTGPDINAYQVGSEHNDEPWSARYAATSDWIELPGLLSVDLAAQLEDRATRATVVLRNVLFPELAAATPFGEIYHAIERGALSPWRGTETDFTPPAVDEPNEWYAVLDQRCQIKVWQGWGEDELVPTFLGFLDDDDIVSTPDTLTLTARCASAIIADQRFYGWSKEREFPDPITFADRYKAEDTSKEGSNPDASSNAADADDVLDGESGTRWISDNHTTPNFTEWIEIELPEGVYDSFRINTRSYSGMTAYVAIDSVDGEVDDVPVSDGWIDGDLGAVPGANGGFEYVRTFTTSDGAKIVWLPFKYQTDGGAKLRIAFRDLKFKAEDEYRAGVVALKGIRRNPAAEARTESWILVDDIADIVRLILRWCGFKEWYVEDADMRIDQNWVVNRGSFLMDMIDEICDRTGFVFFINDPDEDNNSLGFPVFRANQAIFDKNVDEDAIQTVTESDLLERAQLKFTDEPLTYNIRVRGRHATKNQGGVVVSRDDRRLLAYYLPPWTDDDEPVEGTRTAGILKRTFLDRFWIKEQSLLDRTARLVALYQALAAGTALIEIPGNPSIELDQHLILVDRSTGLNTRMWTNARSSHWSGGGDEEPKWTMTVNGGLLDTPMMQAVRDDIAALDEDAWPRTLSSVSVGGITQALGRATETNTARPVTSTKRLVGRATETDTAAGITPPAPGGDVGGTVATASASAFLDSVGVNVHNYYSATNPDNAYEKWTEFVRPALSSLFPDGHGAVRDHLRNPANYPADTVRLKALYTDFGIKLLVTYDTRFNAFTSPAQLVSALVAQGMVAGLKGISGPNEWDKNTAAGASTAARMASAAAVQRALWNAVRANPALNSVPVIAPSTAGPTNIDLMGNIAAYADHGDMHSYPGGQPPRAPLAGTRTLASWITHAQVAVPGKSPWASETGYHNQVPSDTTHPGITEAASAPYIAQLPLAYFREGVTATFFYELVDQLYPAVSGAEKRFGLYKVNRDGSGAILSFTPKTGAVYLQRMMAILNDTGAAPMTPLGSSFSGAPGTMRSMLLQKSSGEWFWCLWNDLSVWNPSTGAVTPQSDATVTLNLEQSRTIKTYDLRVGTSPASTVTGTSKVITLPPALPVLVGIA